jgi:hypothetical protein
MVSGAAIANRQLETYCGASSVAEVRFVQASSETVLSQIGVSGDAIGMQHPLIDSNLNVYSLSVEPLMCKGERDEDERLLAKSRPSFVLANEFVSGNHRYFRLPLYRHIFACILDEKLYQQ